MSAEMNELIAFPVKYDHGFIFDAEGSFCVKSNSVRGKYIAEILNAYHENRWRPIETVGDLPKEGRWWVTWRNVYKEIAVTSGTPVRNGMWSLANGRLEVAADFIIAVMLYKSPTPYQPPANPVPEAEGVDDF